VEGIAAANLRLEERKMVGAVGVDFRGHSRGLLGRQARDAGLANRRDKLTRGVDGKDRNALLAGKEQDLAVVAPVIAPMLVPARLVHKFGLGPEAGVPGIERRLLREGEHLE